MPYALGPVPCANGPVTVIEAIAAGRRAAVSIDKYPGGDGKFEVGSRNAEFGLRPVGATEAYAPEGSEDTQIGINEGVNGYDGRRKIGFAELNRVEVPSLPLSERHGGFSEVELSFTDEQVKEETHRCLQCDLEICLAKADAARQKDR